MSSRPALGTPNTTAATAPAATQEVSKDAIQAESPKPIATVKLPSSSTTPVPPQPTQNAPPPPYEPRLDITAAQTSHVSEDAVPPQTDSPHVKIIPTGPKSGRIVPAIPLPSPARKAINVMNGGIKPTATSLGQNSANQPTSTQSLPTGRQTLEEANHDARAAVAAAMAKLPIGQKKQAEDTSVDILTRKVSEMRSVDGARTSRQSGYVAGHRGGRGVHRGGREQTRKVEVPRIDYDFESANAKFNKQDLVKEAIASGSPTASPSDQVLTNGDSAEPVTNGGRKGSESAVHIPSAVGYNKSSSFFDDISSEIKDRAERKDAGQKFGGREFRNEERQKNLETFGQGSVDNGYRYGRAGGRGRGRGFGRGRNSRGGHDGRGGGRTGIRGGHGLATSEG